MSLPSEGRSLDARTLHRLQCHSFDYFIRESNRSNGLVLDKTAPDWPASIAAVGMALTCYPVGVKRGFIDRDEAIDRTLTTLRFFAQSEQRDTPDASGYRGFYFHFLHMDSGRRAWGCELSSIDTALFIVGALVGAEFFDRDTSRETEIRELARFLYDRIDWTWMLAGRATLCHGWSPEQGFLPYHWQGYDEALVMMFLALGSKTHPIEPACYAAWCETYEWKCIEDIEYLHAGPLFIHQMSQVWCDLRGIRDAAMRDHDSDYFENSRRATRIQQRYAIRNPHGYVHYGEHCWGITASDGPGDRTKIVDGVERRFFDYVARGVPDGPDDGTIAPWAVAASLPFAPQIVGPTITHLARLHIDAPNPYGFKASFNRAFDATPNRGTGWISPFHFGINEGPTVLMIENHRSELIWSLMRRCEPLVSGLRVAGFAGGWLSSADA